MRSQTKTLARAGAAIGVTGALLFLAAPPVSAGGPSLEVEVAGTAACTASGQAQVTWSATVTAPSTTTTLELEPESLGGFSGTSMAVVQFDGEQSGAATGAVTFDPHQITIPASNSSFPVSSQAVVLDPGTSGGTVTLDVTVLVFNPDNPEEDNFTVTGVGSVELPTCEQPTTSTSEAVAADTTTRPTFTG